MGDFSESRVTKLARSASYPSSQEDLFGKLSDDVIIHILSKLRSLKERGKTSVLSHRWRNLWKSSIGTKLIFDNDLYSSVPYCRATFEGIRERYINWVNFILKLYKEPTLDEFTICFNVCSRVLNDWLEFASRKGVKRLQLDLSCQHHDTCNVYRFPSTEKMPISSGLGTLRELSLTSLIIQEKDIQHILSSCCPFLESLYLERVSIVPAKQLKVVGGPSFRLKYLEISCCSLIHKVVISAPNLASLSYDGPEKSLILENVPLLQDLRMGMEYLQQLVNNRSSHFPYAAQIKKLALQFYPMDDRRNTLLRFEFPGFVKLQFPGFIKLEELEVTISEKCGLHSLWPTLLLKALPFLRRFEVKLVSRDLPSVLRFNEANHASLGDINTLCKHKYLKVVEVGGFVWAGYDLDLVNQLICSAKSLEMLILDTNRQHKTFGKKTSSWFVKYLRNLAKEKAKQQLAERLPSGAKLVLI